MKQVNNITGLYNKKIEGTLRKSFMEATNDPNFIKLISKLNLKEDVLMKYTSKLQRSATELSNCKACKGLGHCRNRVCGYVIIPEVKDESLSFYYKPCKYEEKALEEKSSVNYYDIPEFIKEARMSDIYKEKERLDIMKYIKDFIDNFNTGMKNKGLYLSGSFGSGKSYIICALFNEMSKQNLKAVVVYYPSFLKQIKDSFGTYDSSAYDNVLNSDLLLIDDIGAENNTAWSRDEILGSILQYRMDNKLSTFFTSNLTIKELEEHLSSTGLKVDKVKSRRIIERIKQLTNEYTLVSENKRK